MITQNLFVRLKRYQIATNNPEENHATEVLAGCLDLSLELRAAFLRLLGVTISNLPDADAWCVRTQVYIPAGSDHARASFWDLLLENVGDGRVLIVEVKVNAPLTRDQIEKYGSDLKAFGMTDRSAVFTLLRNSSAAPAGWTRVITWTDVVIICRQVQAASPTSGQSTDSKIASRLADYLERENIAMNHDSDDLLGLAKGVRAEQAFDVLAAACERGAQQELDLPAGQFSFSRRSRAYPRLKYTSKLFYADMHLRAAGLENWNAGHTLAIGIGVLQSCVQARDLAREFGAKPWQAWIPHSVGRWRPLGENEEVPAVILESYVYLPLFGELPNQPEHLPPQPLQGVPWETLVSKVRSSFVTAISRMHALEVQFG